MKRALLLAWAAAILIGNPATAQQYADQDRLVTLQSRMGELRGALANRVTILHLNAPLENVLREIGRQSSVNIVFDTDLVAGRTVERIAIRSKLAAEAILEALRAEALTPFVAVDGSVVILPTTNAVEVPRRKVQGQTIRGTVVDRTLRIPLPGANVTIVGTHPLVGTITDVQGRFVLEGVPFGRHDIRVSYIGYETTVLPEVLVSSGRDVVLHVALNVQVLQGEEVVVRPDIRKDQPLNEMALVGARSFSVEETRRYAGGLDDPARMASVFGGVAAGAGIQENAVVIRGNAPKGVQWRLEGIEIPNPNHFAGMAVMGAGGLTLFSSHLLDNSDFYTSAFPADYGNALAGIFDMNFRSGNPVRREHAFQLGVIGIDAASEGPILNGRPSTYLFNYRYSTIGLLLPLLPTEDIARFQDLSFKLHFPLRGSGRLDVWGVGGMDGQSMTASQDSSEWRYETWDRLAMKLRLGVGVIGAAYSTVLGDRSFIRTTAAASINATSLDQKRMSDRLELQDNVEIADVMSRLTLSSFINHRFGARHVNRSGASIQGHFYDFSLRAAIEDLPPPVDVASGTGSSSLLQAYSQSRFDLSRRLILNVGLHATYFALTGAHAVEPRASVRLRFGERHALSVGYGLHSQIEDLRIYFARVAGNTPNTDLSLARAHHGVLTYDVEFGELARLKVEAYMQRLFRVPVIADSSYSLLNFQQDFQFAEALVNQGAGQNVGLDVTVERFLQDGLYYLFTASLFRSTYRGGDDEWRPTRWDRGYTANGLVGREFGFREDTRLLGVNVRASIMGGQRRSPIDRVASRIREEVVFDERRAFSERESGLFLVDVTVTYRRNRRRVSDVWALQVKNAFGAKETVLDYNYKTKRIDAVREGFPLPVLSYKIEF